MRFGVNLPTSGHLASSSFIRDVALCCEELGYDSVWMSDHMTWTATDAAEHHPEAPDEPGSLLEPRHYDPISTLSYLAGTTTRIRLGTSVMVLPVRNPVALAKQAATLDELSGGRVLLGVGVGGTHYADAEFGAVGAQHLRPHRGRVTDEWIEVMRLVWSQPTCSYHGDFIDVVNASVYPKPVQPGGPPILLGGDSASALRRLARLGDGSIVSRLGPGDIEPRRRELAELAAAHGRADTHFHLVALQWLSIAGDERSATDRAAEALGRTMRGGRPVLESPTPRFVGTAGQLQQLAAAYADAGLDEVILQVVGSSESLVLESIERFATEVIDQLDLDRTPSVSAAGGDG